MSPTEFTAVYGPVYSWRYGRSLGIDPIGAISICSFNCVYCQLGEIEIKTSDRGLFVPTEKILQDLQSFAPWDVDVITLSGSGEPTLALNLADILSSIKTLTHKPTAVLTNGTLLHDASVRQALTLADKVAIKLDGISPNQLQRVNRPVPSTNWQKLWQGILQFRREFSGELAIQTMMLTPWNAHTQGEYIQLMEILQPTEIQLNTPTRPKPTTHQLEARGNHVQPHANAAAPYPVKMLKPVSSSVLQAFASAIEQATGIRVRCASFAAVN